MPSKSSIFYISLFILILIFSRIYNLEKTARFIWDESSDLVSIHQIFVNHKITLIGPISEDGNKVFGSLTYYMLLPFAILGKFDPVSTTYGAAFWGIFTGVLILYLVYKVNEKYAYFAAPLIVIWYPLVETGRWAWNPNLILFWATIALIAYFRRNKLSLFLTGIFMGLSIHLHYLSIFACLGFGIVILIEQIKAKDIKKFGLYTLGVFITLLPFVLFDLTHKPGLFISRVFYFNYFGKPAGSFGLISKIIEVLNGTFLYFSQNTLIEIVLFIILLVLMYFDIKNKSKALIFEAVFLIQIVGISFVGNFYTHYILPGLPFFLVYLFYSRKGISKILAISAITLLLISGLLTFKNQLNKITWQTDIASTRYVSNIIANEIYNKNLKNINLVVLDSPDTNIYGRRYRDILLLKNTQQVKNKNEYNITDHLFVISTSPLNDIRRDAAYEIETLEMEDLKTNG